MRLVATSVLVVLVVGVAGCGGGGDGGNGDTQFSVTPTSGSPGTVVSVQPACDDPPLTAGWTDSAGGSIFVASGSEDSGLGITHVPDGLAAGAYTLSIRCGTEAVGETTFDVTG